MMTVNNDVYQRLLNNLHGQGLKLQIMMESSSSKEGTDIDRVMTKVIRQEDGAEAVYLNKQGNPVCFIGHADLSQGHNNLTYAAIQVMLHQFVHANTPDNTFVAGDAYGMTKYSLDLKYIWYGNRGATKNKSVDELHRTCSTTGVRTPYTYVPRPEDLASVKFKELTDNGNLLVVYDNPTLSKSKVKEAIALHLNLIDQPHEEVKCIKDLQKAAQSETNKTLLVSSKIVAYGVDLSKLVSSIVYFHRPVTKAQPNVLLEQIRGKAHRPGRSIIYQEAELHKVPVKVNVDG
ncbi:hypothetical protein GR11A_00236 [Vibrio phage vB_VcorM_GR11A]|nr:hypothetical protein GR11A_00236 [Vibrio phage vB_VcorM_GR11A]